MHNVIQKTTWINILAAMTYKRGVLNQLQCSILDLSVHYHLHQCSNCVTSSVITASMTVTCKPFLYHANTFVAISHVPIQ